MKLFPVCGAVIFLVVSGFLGRSRAQDNSWISPAGGNWQDATWSLGVLPGTNQTVLLTNAGSKTVQINAGTVLDFPQSLNIEAIVISSPTNATNTLWLNSAGWDTPLTVKSVSVASNSAMVMASSALQLNGGNGVGLSVGGEFDQNDSSVAGRQIDVGYSGPGVYNLNSGSLAVANLWVGGQFQGVFNQNGGTNAFGITDVEGGNYVLRDGYFAATIYFNDFGTFTQEGGLLDADLAIFDGYYLLQGGVHRGSITLPSTDGFNSGGGAMVQTGGTNYGSLDIGSYGYSSYTMSNGVSFSTNLLVDYGGAFTQWGGTEIIDGGVTVSEAQVSYGYYSQGAIYLNGGEFSCGGMHLDGNYSQGGGTNFVAGDLTMFGAHSAVSLSGGLLAVDNLEAEYSWVGGVFLSGGTMWVTNELLVLGNPGLPQWRGFVGTGGQLIASDISLGSQASFSCGVSAITQSGTLAMTNATLSAGSGPEQFGRLLLANGGSTNSTLMMPAAASVVHFADSSGMPWSNEPLLIVQNWSGSLYGGGQQQIIFGSNSAALTASQLGQIQFQNPAGLAVGSYPARILANGEVVPNSGGPLPASMALTRQTEGMQVRLQGEAGRSYSIEVSSNLVNWTPWTNVFNSKGTMCVTDTDSTNCPVRFYRAKLAP
jgi:hypothetical protein